MRIIPWLGQRARSLGHFIQRPMLSKHFTMHAPKYLRFINHFPFATIHKSFISCHKAHEHCIELAKKRSAYFALHCFECLKIRVEVMAPRRRTIHEWFYARNNSSQTSMHESSQPHLISISTSHDCLQVAF